MEIASVVIEIRNGSCGDVLSRLAVMPSISVYGITENQIVTVIEGDDADAVQGMLKKIHLLEDVIGVYPVFIGNYE